MKIIKCTFPLILSFLGFLIYSNVLYAPFIFDDNTYIADNYRLRNISETFKDFLGARYIGSLSFALNYYFGGLNTFGYHLVNIIIHILNAILVYFFIQLTIGVQGGCPLGAGSRVQESFTRPLDPLTPRILPFAVSLIFLVHPIQTQAVTYITQRFTSLATLFYLLAIVLYVKARVKEQESRNRSLDLLSNTAKAVFLPSSFSLYILSIIFTILAMKTKEIGFTLPFIIALYEFTFFKKNDSQHTTLNSRLAYLIPFFLTLLIIPLTLLFPYEYVNPWLKHEYLQNINTISKYSYLLTQFSVIVTYIRLLILPINQRFDYDYPLSHSIFEPAVFLTFTFFLSIIIFAVYLYIRSRKRDNSYGLLISFGIFWFFITLSVESSIIPIADVIFEHRLYLPSIGFIISVITSIFYLFDHLQQKIEKPISKYLFVIISMLAFIFSISTYQRNLLWGDTVKMYLNEIDKSPNAAHLHSGLGDAYRNKGMISEATNEYLTAIKLGPNSAKAHYGLGSVYASQNRLDESIKEYMAVLDSNNSNDEINAIAHHSLGDAYHKQGRLEDAKKEYLIALRLQPYYADVYNNLGNVFFKQGLFDEAIKVYMAALKIKPYSAEAHNNLGNVFYKQGRLDEAIKEYLDVLRINPDFAESYYSLGFVYYNQGRFTEAIKEFITALSLKPDYLDAYINIGSAYYKLGLFDEAIKEYSAALKIKPDYTEVHYNLGVVYSKQGQLDEAIKEYMTVLKLKPEFVEAHYNLGNTYRIKGLKDEAIREFEIALKLKPDFAPAKEGVEALKRASVKSR